MILAILSGGQKKADHMINRDFNSRISAVV